MSKVKSQSLGEIIKEAMIDRGLNQSAIARKMGVAKQTINQIERKKIFDLDFLVKFRSASGLDFTSYALPNDNKDYVESHTTRNLMVGDNMTNAVEMSLNIKIKGETDNISKMSELLLVFRTEAMKLGFNIQ
jgi:transcriptional regulator with XRE-family HTH domain